MREVLAQLNGTLKQRLPCVYCTVVETRGSTPQKAGASMLVYPNGQQFGTLGGGCVEAEVKQRALRALYAPEGRPELSTFHLNDDYGWDDGLICGGRMTILLHPLAGDRADSPGALAYYARLQELLDQGQGLTEAVVIGETAGLCLGDRYLFAGDGAAALCLAERPAWNIVQESMRSPAAQRRTATHAGITYLRTRPRITLLLVGGGHVGQAVARLASDVGFDIWVMDDREAFANRERFPAAQRLFVGDIGATLQELAPRLPGNVYAVILTRGHNHDEEALYHLAGSACGYVGMIGSQRKIKLIFEDLVARGISPEVLQRVHAPLGLPIGSQTVPEIAISIVAELIACRNQDGDEPAQRCPASVKEQV